MRYAFGLMCGLLFVVVGGCAEFKEAGRSIGHGTRDAAESIGAGTKRVINETAEKIEEATDD